jgi:hypothetical protein
MTQEENNLYTQLRRQEDRETAKKRRDKNRKHKYAPRLTRRKNQ